MTLLESAPGAGAAPPLHKMDVSEGRRMRRTRWSMTWPPLVAFVAFVSAWQWLPGVLDIKSYVLPVPTDVVRAGADNWSEFSGAILLTSQRSIMGFVLSGVVGVIAAVVMASSEVLRRVLYPYAVILHTIPIVSIAPLIIIWMGTGTSAILTISFTIGFFTVLANTLSGLLSASNNSVDLFRVYHARNWQVMFKLRLPSALPYVMTALKISCTLSVIGAIIGEYMAGSGGSRGGLGYTLVAAVTRFQTAYVFAVAIVSALLGVAFYLIVNFISNRILGSWHESAMRREA